MNLNNDIENLQKLGLGNPLIKIAILDGPVDTHHSCFKLDDGTDILGNNDSAPDDFSMGLALKHGTAITSLIFGTPNSEVKGIAPNCSSLIIPIYSDDSNGVFSSSNQVDLARAIEIAVEKGANIINISGGEFSRTGDSDTFLDQAIEKCFKAGVLIVAAAGNDGCNCLHLPAADHRVLAVGSMDELGNPTPETNFGKAYQTNGILFPGTNLKAAKAGGGTIITDGETSYAAPIATGVIGLLMSYQISKGYPADPFVVRSIIEKTVIPCFNNEKQDCKRYLKGKINLSAILTAITNNPEILDSDKESKNKTNQLVTPSDINQVIQEDKNVNPSGKKKIQEKISEKTEQITRKNQLTNNNLNMENNKENQELEMTSVDKLTLEPSLSPAGDVSPSACGCNKDKNKDDEPTLVYALGTIGFDFGSESQRDSIAQSMGGKNPYDLEELISHLTNNPWDAEELIWTLSSESTPIYRLIPSGSFVSKSYDMMINFLKEQKKGAIQRISVPGMSKGDTALQNGHKVANLFFRLRGMYSWSTEALVKETLDTKGSPKGLTEQVKNFLDQIYYKVRNLGATPEHRSLNYAATNAFQVSEVFSSALQENLELDDISATKSPICSPGADCYDVVLSFFNPKERLTQARKQYRFTIDVSNVVPVTLGEIRSWSIY